jgi:hypothetical protein
LSLLTLSESFCFIAWIVKGSIVFDVYIVISIPSVKTARESAIAVLHGDPVEVYNIL